MTKNEKLKNQEPGDGIRNIRTTNVFRIINFELYAKPNIVVMTIGASCFALAIGYIAYMRHKYESMGYYPTIDENGKELYDKKKSKWD